MNLVLDDIGYQPGGEPHIQGVSLELEAGSMNVLLGPTLSGKTTLMRLMAGLDRPTHGRLLLDGKDVTGMPVRRRSVAMVYQQFVNYPTLSVFENIASPLRVAGVSGAEADKRVGEAARLLGLQPMLGRTPLQLSGGQQQRVAIARALVKRADLVLLDEPLANLDYKLREELREELPRLFAESGAILVYATTEPSEALLLGGRTVTLWEGRVTQVGPTAEVYRRPRSIAAARVFSDPPLNELDATKTGGTLEVAGRRVPAAGVLAGLPDGRVTLGFRAEDVALDSGARDGLAFQGRVLVTEITGSESFVHVAVPESHRAFVALVRGVTDLPPDAPVAVSVDPARVYAFGADGQLVAAGPAVAPRVPESVGGAA